MTPGETAAIISILTARYGQVSWEPDPTKVHAMWHAVLADCPADAVQEVAAEWARREDRAPDPAELRRMVVDRAARLPGEAAALKEATAHLTSREPRFRGSRVVSETVQVLGGWDALRRMTPTDRQRYWRRAYEAVADERRDQTERDLALSWGVYCGDRAVAASREPQVTLHVIPWAAIPLPTRQALTDLLMREADRRGSWYTAKAALVQTNGDAREAARLTGIELPAVVPELDTGAEETKWVRPKELAATTSS